MTTDPPQDASAASAHGTPQEQPRWRINSRGTFEVFWDGDWQTAGTSWSHPDQDKTTRFREARAEAVKAANVLRTESETLRAKAALADRAAKSLGIMGHVDDTWWHDYAALSTLTPPEKEQQG